MERNFKFRSAILGQAAELALMSLPALFGRLYAKRGQLSNSTQQAKVAQKSILVYL